MPAVEAAFAVALQGVGGHGDDRGMGAGGRLAGADGGGRLEAVHLRHLHVHQHGIERPAVQGRQRLAAVAGDHDLMALLLQQADGQPLVDGVVLGQQEPQPAPARRRRVVGGRPGRRGHRRSPSAEGGHDRVQEGRLPDGFGQVGGHPQFPAAGGVLAPVGRRQHHEGGPHRLRVLADPLGEGEAVHLGHHGIQKHQGERRSRLARLLEGGQRLAAPLDDGRPHPPVGEHFLEDPPVGGVVVHDQDGQAVHAGGLRRRRPRHRTTRRGEPRREVERASRGRPGSPARSPRPSSGPAGPRSPDPAPCRRTCGWWTCRPGRRPRRASAAVGGIPMPVSLTAKWRQTSSSVRDRTSTRSTTSPRSVNLMALPTRLTTTWQRRWGSPDERVRHVGRDVVGEFQPFLVGAHGERGHGVVEGVAEVEIDEIQVELAGLDLGEVEDVVDHGQQVIGRELHHAEVLALLGGQLGVEGQLGHADDAVHRRADLVAHVGQELALGAGGGLGGLLGLAHGGLGLLLGVDVGVYADPLADPTLPGQDGDGPDKHVPIFPVVPAQPVFDLVERAGGDSR